MVAERKIFEEEGLEKYVQYQQKNEDEPLKAGAAFPFVKVILITGCPIEGYYNFLIKAVLCNVCPTDLGGVPSTSLRRANTKKSYLNKRQL